MNQIATVFEIDYGIGNLVDAVHHLNLIKDSEYVYPGRMHQLIDQMNKIIDELEELCDEHDELISADVKHAIIHDRQYAVESVQLWISHGCSVSEIASRLETRIPTIVDLIDTET